MQGAHAGIAARNCIQHHSSERSQAAHTDSFNTFKETQAKAVSLPLCGPAHPRFDPTICLLQMSRIPASGTSLEGSPTPGSLVQANPKPWRHKRLPASRIFFLSTCPTFSSIQPGKGKAGGSWATRESPKSLFHSLRNLRGKRLGQGSAFCSTCADCALKYQTSRLIWNIVIVPLCHLKPNQRKCS